MIKTLFVSAALIAGTSSFAFAGMQTGRSVSHHRHHHHVMMSQTGGNGVAANGRCGGVSYGTGARRCGTATGGPVGGLTNRN